MASEKAIRFTLDFVREEIVKKEQWIASHIYPIWGNCPTRVILLYGGRLGDYPHLDPAYALSNPARATVLYHGKRTGLPAYFRWAKMVLGSVVYLMEYDRKHIVRTERETFTSSGTRGREFQRALNNTVHALYYPGYSLHFSKMETGPVRVRNGSYLVFRPEIRNIHDTPAPESNNVHSADYARLQAEYERHIARLQRNPEP